MIKITLDNGSTIKGYGEAPFIGDTVQARLAAARDELYMATSAGDEHRVVSVADILRIRDACRAFDDAFQQFREEMNDGSGS